ncbi:low specificity L-threonine aldolase [Asticcacaulis biprosthecium C19]|uniref:L-threonine aldolase n=1 Tax=Asticcacaulis biprosthecium C19 TaxID=715226 RepID=F4QNR0_9CAUL|nr:low specificity L-threonine aldolase [Asticcacaulis biprosthecium]EGF90968.1 low specificity L-threonine aldolase [Asticcacaulis biprosthecium C19]
MASFASDNTAPVHPKVLAALATANNGAAPAYGNDRVTARLRETVAEVFHCPDVSVFPVFNGSACNGLALARMIRPYESILCHRQAHINNDECGLPEFFTGGKIVPIDGFGAKLTVAAIGDTIAHALEHAPHTSRPRAISLTQSTELGTVYSMDELATLTAFARTHGLYVHMDGARIANAVASLGCAPHEVVKGVDILSFGGTKNGAMLAEAAVIFNPVLAEDFAYIHKRAGQLPSKARFVSAQLQALLEDGLWLELGGHANAMARLLAEGLQTVAGVALLYPVEANELFVTLPRPVAQKLFAKGHQFYPWPAEGPEAYRLVTSFATTKAEVDGFLGEL